MNPAATETLGAKTLDAKNLGAKSLGAETLGAETLGAETLAAARLAPGWWAALAGLPVLVFLVRALGFLPSVTDWDESLYVLQASQWLRGGWPLVAVWDMHPIGAPAMFTGAMLVMGESIFAIRMLGVLAVSATGWGLFAAARAAGAPPSVGYAAALLYAGHSLLLGGMSVNTEILFAPFTTAAIAVALGGAALPGGA